MVSFHPQDGGLLRLHQRLRCLGLERLRALDGVFKTHTVLEGSKGGENGECHGISWDFVVFYGILWGLIAISWDFMEFCCD
jgi:hypothetical protein